MSADLVNWMRRILRPDAQQLDDVCWRPAADVYRTAWGWLLKFDLAGVRPDEVEVHVRGNQVRVSGVRRDCSVEEGCCSYRMEIAYSHFERTLELPVVIEHAQISLDCRDGMLFVRIVMEKSNP